MPPMTSIRGTPYAYELFTRSMLSRIVQATRPQRGGYQTPLAFAIMQVRINLMPYGLPTIAFRLFKLPLISRFRARDFSLIKRWFSPLSLAHRVRGAQAIFSPKHFLKPSLGYVGINLWAFSPSAPATASSLNHVPAGFIGHAVVALLAFLVPRPPPLAFVSRRGGWAFVVGACAPHLLCIGRALSLDTNFAIFI